MTPSSRVYGLGLALYALVYRLFLPYLPEHAPGALARNELVSLAAVAGLLHLWRRSTGTLALLCAAVCLKPLWFGARHASNSNFLFTLVCAYTLVQLATKKGEALERGLEGGARVAAVSLYAFAALAKLNSGFLLSAADSCASWGYEAARLYVPLPDADAARLACAWATLLLEASAAAALATRRFSGAGAALALLLQLVFGVVPVRGISHSSFSIMALPLLWLCLPAELRARWLEKAGRAVSPRAAGAGLAVLAAAAFLPLPPLLKQRLAAALWLAGGTAAIVWLRASWTPARAELRWSVGLGAALLLNGLSPYLGLKSENALLMYSNLRTEPGLWNHLLLPEGVRVFGFQEPLVSIESSTLPKQSDGDGLARGESLPLGELRSTVASWSAAGHQARVVYVRGGAVEELDAASQPPGVLRRWRLRGRLLPLRKVPPPASPAHAPRSFAGRGFSAAVCAP